MGLAASQARLLGLTARKSNVEYKGQQINQQRTALSNEVMGLYNEYNKLKVPVAPSANDYTKTTYTIDSTFEKYQIDSFTQILDGENQGYYNVQLKYVKDMAKAYTRTVKDTVLSVVKTKAPEGEEPEPAQPIPIPGGQIPAEIPGNETEKKSFGYDYISFQFGTETYVYDVNNPDTSTITKITGDYEKYQGLSTIMKEQGLTESTFYMYMMNGVAYYTSENDLDSTEYEDIDGKTMYYGAYTFDYQGSLGVPETVNGVAALTQQGNGRLSTIYFIDSDDPDLIDNTYSITTGTEDDQTAFNDALNQYYYDKDQYEREIQRINLKTETLQAEDRSLELQLNQLDTEQKAISTEMDSLTNTIKETIETVFKTFE